MRVTIRRVDPEWYARNFPRGVFVLKGVPIRIITPEPCDTEVEKIIRIKGCRFGVRGAPGYEIAFPIVDRDQQDYN